MMTLNEKASYIKGLCDGMELDTASKEGKVISALLDLVSDMALAIEAPMALSLSIVPPHIVSGSSG